MSNDSKADTYKFFSDFGIVIYWVSLKLDPVDKDDIDCKWHYNGSRSCHVNATFIFTQGVIT